ncbi:hypothetical protein [Burkholderia gladioli]|uniref:hypothetical protein n=1 Tax=Burkholderia gladioli TaxID=28095 RepID=UPI00163FC7EC|nr:hypothetical protein [Burkholderia gladioli]
MAFRTLAQAAAFGETAGQYQRLRAAHPTIRALTIHRYIHDDQGMSLEQFQCETERGHVWSYSGTAYGGDDESFHGEGRCYCIYCGRDGDA